jgi:hypothetical protein
MGVVSFCGGETVGAREGTWLVELKLLFFHLSAS